MAVYRSTVSLIRILPLFSIICAESGSFLAQHSYLTYRVFLLYMCLFALKVVASLQKQKLVSFQQDIR